MSRKRPISSASLAYIVLFTGLGVFSYLLLLADGINRSAEVGGVLSSAGALAFIIVAFNILGFATIRSGEWITRQYPLYIRQRWKIALIYGAVALALLLLNYGLIVLAKLLAGAAHPFTFPYGGLRLLVVVWLAELVILGLLLANRSMQSAMKSQQEAARLKAENDAALYAALQNQLNPHFLFNTLNTLIAEIEYDPRNAVQFTAKLSNVYRYVLQQQDKPLVALREELEFADAYLFLHEVRLGGYISSRADIPEDYRESMLPPLTLQLLVENIVKHNTIGRQHPMEIRIAIDDGMLVVSNPIHPRQGAPSSGIGLENLSKRCRLMMDRDIVVDDSGGVFTVKIPLLYE